MTREEAIKRVREAFFLVGRDDISTFNALGKGELNIAPLQWMQLALILFNGATRNQRYFVLQSFANHHQRFGVRAAVEQLVDIVQQTYSQ